MTQDSCFGKIRREDRLTGFVVIVCGIFLLGVEIIVRIMYLFLF